MLSAYRARFASCLVGCFTPTLCLQERPAEYLPAVRLFSPLCAFRAPPRTDSMTTPRQPPQLRQLSAYGPNVVNIGLPPKQPHSVAAASAPAQPPRAAPAVRFPREQILLGRWRRRARQRLLQSHARRVGRLVHVRQGWQVWRAWRARTLARWHKRISAELHRWLSLIHI